MKAESPVATADVKRPILKLLLRIAVTGGLLWWVLQKISFADFRGVVAEARWEYLLLVCLFNALLFWIRAYRSQLIFRQLDCRVSVSTLFGASAVMMLYGMVLPGVLSLAAKWQVLKRITGRGSYVLSGMLYNQVAVMLVMLTFGLPALLLAGPSQRLSLNREGQATALYVCTGIGLIVVLALYACICSPVGSLADAGINALILRLPARLGQKGRTVMGQLALFRTVGLRFHLAVAALTFVTGVLGGAFLFKLAAMSVAVAVPFLVFVWVYALVYLLGRLPISVANCGVREFVLVSVLGSFGIDSASALLMSVILFGAGIFMAFMGALYQLSWSLTRKRTL